MAVSPEDIDGTFTELMFLLVPSIASGTASPAQ